MSSAKVRGAAAADLRNVVQVVLQAYPGFEGHALLYRIVGEEIQRNSSRTPAESPSVATGDIEDDDIEDEDEGLSEGGTAEATDVEEDDKLPQNKYSRRLSRQSAEKAAKARQHRVLTLAKDKRLFDKVATRELKRTASDTPTPTKRARVNLTQSPTAQKKVRQVTKSRKTTAEDGSRKTPVKGGKRQGPIVVDD